MKVLIIEDEKLSAEHLKDLLLRLEKDLQVLGIIDSIEDSVNWFEKNEQPDLLFLDIQLADGLSFNIFHKVDIKCPIIFTTAFDNFAIQAFKVNSIDYLLKPINQKTISAALKKYRELKDFMSENGEQSFNYKNLQAQFTTTKIFKTRFTVKSGNKLIVVSVPEISYFVSDGHYTRLVCRNRLNYLINFTLDELEEILDQDIFYRLNRKFIAKIEAIEEIHLYFKGRLKLKLHPDPEQEVIVSSEKSAAFKQWLEK
jgi:two-component system, LytTR family, response regulator LytT